MAGWRETAKLRSMRLRRRRTDLSTGAVLVDETIDSRWQTYTLTYSRGGDDVYEAHLPLCREAMENDLKATALVMRRLGQPSYERAGVELLE